MSVVGAGTLIAAPADAAGSYTITGVITNYDGSYSGVEIVACRADCLSGTADVDDFTFMNSATHTFELNLPTTGTYHLGVAYLDQEPNYTKADGALAPDGWLYKAPGATRYSVNENFDTALSADVTSTSAVSVGTIQIGQAIHNPESQFKQVTPGTVDQQPCAGHPTTFLPTPFSDLPADATVTYQWYAGSSQSDKQPIPGATGTTYTSTASQVGQELFVGMVAAAPNRVAFDGIGSIGSVGNPGSCVPSVVVTSWGKKHGKAVHGHKVSIKGAKAAGGISTSYNWTLNGKVVHHGKSYKLPKSARHKKLAVQVVFSAPGYQSVSKTLTFGKVK